MLASFNAFFISFLSNVAKDWKACDLAKWSALAKSKSFYNSKTFVRNLIDLLDKININKLWRFDSSAYRRV